MYWKPLRIVVFGFTLSMLPLTLSASPRPGTPPTNPQDKPSQDGPPQGSPANRARHWNEQVASSQTLQIGGSTLQIDFAAGSLDLTPTQILPWIQRAAQAVIVYYGHFPVARARILIVPAAGQRGVLQGTTWGDMHGWPGFTRIRLGQHTTLQDLVEDWTMTHELVHLAFPGLPDDQHWMEEGLATYIEPIARVQAGELSAKQVWQDMIEGMPKGEPGPGDQGIDRTHTWGRTYWGGALFCLVADVNIRKQTNNRKGLQDALHAIVAASGTIDHDWPLMKALEVGDQATGTTVLTDQYKQWSENPSPVDLPKLWKDLGVSAGQNGADFNSNAPFAQIRDAIMTTPQSSRHTAQR
jgi:hypothetical protein